MVSPSYMQPIASAKSALPKGRLEPVMPVVGKNGMPGVEQ